MEGESSADRRGGRYHVILCVVIGEMTLSTCLLCRLLTQDENQSVINCWACMPVSLTVPEYRLVVSPLPHYLEMTPPSTFMSS